MPLPILAWVLAAVTTLGTVMLVCIHWSDIVEWFQNRTALKQADRDNIAVTLKEQLASGEYRVVQGIFNTRTEAVVDGQVLKSNKIDQQTEEVHRNNNLVVYQ
jgi:hypothetical protein